MKIICTLIFTFLLTPFFMFEAKAQTDTTFWWNDDVFYEAFVRSFYDSNGDGIGDLQGLTSKLDYIQGLGADAIWLMPVCPSPSYHGYDITNYEDINPQYGTRQDYINFVTACHSRGMKVIFDAVMNHTSNQHPWFTQSQANDSGYSNFYRWSGNNPNYDGPWGEQVWYKQGSPNYYYGIFSNVMPDLYYINPVVKDSMFNVVNFWLDSMNVDGFRCDAAPYIIEDGEWQQNTPATIQFWKDFHTQYTTAKPNSMAVGEVWMPDDTILEYMTGGGLDFCFEFNLAGAIIGAVDNGSVQQVSGEFQYIYDNFPFAQYGTFLSNHDQVRSFDQLGDNIPNAKVAAATYMTLPGIPFVYYGEEIGMVGSSGNPAERSPMQWTAGNNAGFTTGTPWEAINGNYATYNVATESADSNSLLNWYIKLIAVRHANPVLRRGTYFNIANKEGDIYSFVRSYNGQNVLVVINTGGNIYGNHSFNLTGAGITDGIKTISELLTGTTFLDSVAGQQLGGILVNAYSSAIYLLTDSAQATGLTGPVSDAGFSAKVIPNPNNGRMYVDIQQTGKAPVNVTVVNTVGQAVYNGNINVTNSWLDLSAQPNGMYFVYLKSNAGDAVEKVMIAR